MPLFLSETAWSFFDRFVTAVTGRERLWSYFIQHGHPVQNPTGRFQIGKTIEEALPDGPQAPPTGLGYGIDKDRQ